MTDKPLEGEAMLVPSEADMCPREIFVQGRTVQVTADHIRIAKLLYAQRPFVMGSTSTTHGASIGRAFDWDGAPAYYQSDMLELAHAVLPALSPIPNSEAPQDEAGERAKNLIAAWAWDHVSEDGKTLKGEWITSLIERVRAVLSPSPSPPEGGAQ